MPEKAYKAVQKILGVGFSGGEGANLLDEGLFLFLNLQDFRFDRVLRDELVDMDWFALSNAVNSVHSLAFNTFL